VGTAWTKPREAEFRRLWNEGAAIGAMMAALNCPSRSALCAKARRLGLPLRRTEPNGFSRNGQPPDTWRGRERAPRYSPIEDSVPDSAIALLQLNVDSCRWPYGDVCSPPFGFCGQHAALGSSYCPAHLLRAYGK
jgi:GcrA cell cycle regulator